MRNPERWRNIGLAAFLGGPLLVLAAFQVPAGYAGDGVRAALFCLGLMGLMFGGVGGWMAQRKVRAQMRMARGEGVLARWRIPAGQWRDFVALDAERNAAGDRFPNEFSPREEVPAEGVEIVVGEDAISIDGSVHDLPRHGSPEITRYEFDESRARSSVIEFDLSYPAVSSNGGTRPPIRTRLCFPVPPDTQTQARRVLAHFGQLGPGRRTFFHGPGDGSDSEDLSTCWRCGAQTFRYVSSCPKCGAGMLSRRWARRFGGVLVLLGLPLALGVGWLLWWMLPMLMNPGVEFTSGRFGGSPAQARMVIAIMSAVTVFGLLTIGNGLWQLVTGKRNLKAVAAMLVVAGGLFVFAWLL